MDLCLVICVLRSHGLMFSDLCAQVPRTYAQKSVILLIKVCNSMNKRHYEENKEHTDSKDNSVTPHSVIVHYYLLVFIISSFHYKTLIELIFVAVDRVYLQTHWTSVNAQFIMMDLG